MKLILLLLGVLWLNLAIAQKATPYDYIAQYATLAQTEMKRSGVPAAITLAQGILESESGNSELALKSNNHFGIKCKSNWTGAKVYHNDDARGECFRKYDNVEQSFIDHSDFLKANERYSFLFDLEVTDYFGWAKGLKKAGYATNPVYAQKLIDIIEKYELHKYNDFAYGAPNKMNAALEMGTGEAIKDEPIEEPKEAAPAMKTEPPMETEDASIVEIEKQYGQKPFQHNGIKAVRVLAGTSLLALADQYKLSLSKLLEFNDLPKSTNDITAKDAIFYLQKKKKTGNVASYIVKNNETLHDIAQAQGIKLEFLLKLNNLTNTSKIKPGDALVLQSKNSVFKQKTK